MSRTRENLPARRRKKRTTPSFRLTILITVLVIIVAAAGALMAPGLNVTEIYCEGNVNLSSEEIAAVSQIKTGTNILLANTSKAEREIKKLPFVNTAEVKRELPDKICIRINERVPAAYVKAGTEGVVIGTEGIILKKLDSTMFGSIVVKNTPAPPVKAEKDKDDKKEDTESTEEQGEADADEAEVGQAENEMVQTEQPEVVYSVPLIEGIEVKNTDEGKEVRCDDKEKLKMVLEICKALEKAQLLNRATFLDVTDTIDIRLIIENRLDIQLGTADNIEYRAKFLSEVVNTGISVYEKAVVDYRGDDVYVRAPEDGKARTIPKHEEEEVDENTDDSDDETVDESSEAEDETDNSSEDESQREEDGAQIGEL